MKDVIPIEWDEDGYDYGVSSEKTLYQSDCAGILEFISELSKVNWSGYLVNHTQKMYIDVVKYYEMSKINEGCIFLIH